MFGSLMKGIAQDFVKYVMHVQVDPQRCAGTERAERAAIVERQRAADGFSAAAQAAAASGDIDPDAAAQAAPAPVKQQTIVKDEWSKTPRNAPCPCGWQEVQECHGATGLNARPPCVTSPTISRTCVAASARHTVT